LTVRSATVLDVRDEHVELRGYSPRLVDDGQGYPIVLVHGTPLDLNSWDPLVTADRAAGGSRPP
jgi:pimeloyl-ACP methyl ester carboxylesterase